MDINTVAQARLRLALEAAQRWQIRQAERATIQTNLRSGGSALADSPVRVERFRQRQQRPAEIVTDVQLSRFDSRALFTERMIGPRLDWEYFPPNELARLSGVPVARIVILAERDREAIGFGTGFLVAPGVLLTNHHVLTGQQEARGIGAHFLYERIKPQLNREGVFFELDPDAFFITDQRLDFTLVAVKSTAISGESLALMGMLPLIGAIGKILIGQPINIIQHPNGEVKRYATSANTLLDLPDADFMHYETDTLPGSSGSPAFNTRWEVVGLHHSGVPEIRAGQIIARNGQPWDSDTGEDNINWVANEGVRISALVEHLRQVIARNENPMQAARLSQLLELGNPPLSDGRISEPGSSLEPRASQPPEDRVIDLEARRGVTGMVVFNISGPTTINVAAADAPPVAVARATAPIDDGSGALEKKLEFDSYYADRTGYAADFLTGFTVPLPSVAAARQRELLTVSGEPLILHYHHYSLVMNQPRRLLVWSAVNVDYSPVRRPFKGGRKDFGSDDWRPDPRISSAFQIQDAELYKGTQFDRGHVVRRDDNAWGDTIRQQEFANADTFHYTNCTPQHKAFNQALMQGLWGQLEDFIKTAIGAVGNRACIYAGPILAGSDPTGEFDEGPIQYPVRFWKVFVAVEREDHQSVLRAYGFILDQSAVIERFGLNERLDFGELSTYQVALEDITNATGVTFDPTVLNADVMKAADAPAAKQIKLGALEAIQLR